MIYRRDEAMLPLFKAEIGRGVFDEKLFVKSGAFGFHAMDAPTTSFTFTEPARFSAGNHKLVIRQFDR